MYLGDKEGRNILSKNFLLIQSPERNNILEGEQLFVLKFVLWATVIRTFETIYCLRMIRLSIGQ